MNNLIWIGPALIFGFLATRLGLPPMVGYLIGGFIMNIFDFMDTKDLSEMGELGVTLLLFTIGLKLDVRSLLKPYVWAGATLHMLIVVVVFGIALFWISLTGLSLFAGVDFTIALLIAFALSFSSTVFAVKTLEEKGELQSRHGQIAIGFLIMQDIFAVVFLGGCGQRRLNRLEHDFRVDVLIAMNGIYESQDFTGVHGFLSINCRPFEHRTTTGRRCLPSTRLIRPRRFVPLPPTGRSMAEHLFDFPHRQREPVSNLPVDRPR